MEATKGPSSALFDVYLRLRPNSIPGAVRFLEVEEQEHHEPSTHITIHPPLNDGRKRAIEKFGFTRVFEEHSSQLDVFHGTTILPLIEGVLAPSGKAGRDALVATLGVTGSGKSHTILGSKSQRGLTQMILSVLYNSIDRNLTDVSLVLDQLVSDDASEAQILSSSAFLESVYGDADQSSRASSRAQTPMLVSNHVPPASMSLYRSLMSLGLSSKNPVRRHFRPPSDPRSSCLQTPSSHDVFKTISKGVAKLAPSKQMPHDSTPATPVPSAYSKRNIPQPGKLPQEPSMKDVQVATDRSAEYIILISMYEVYNDKIFDLLAVSASASKTPARDTRRRALLFKGTEQSQERKVVAGLRKIACSSVDEALMVLETGLTERRVAGTGSNAVSSRSHGFFGIEVKKRNPSRASSWSGSTLTIVDLAGSERARTAKTAGATLAEAGKINESLMYLGQCMQMQSDNSALFSAAAGDTSSIYSGPVAGPRPGLVPFRQCKLTELLFSNGFHERTAHRNAPAQKAIMIVTADPRGDFNATSQILKYSALAREVTVPRIPSVASTIMSGPTTIMNPTADDSQGMESDISSYSMPMATSEELHRMLEEMSVLRLQLEDETRRRQEAEAAWQSSEERLEDIEAEVREECWTAFEDQLTAEKEKLFAAWSEEAQRNERHLDSKLDVLSRTLAVDEANGQDSSRQRTVELEEENARLREKVNALLREKETSRTPSRKLKPLKARAWNIEHDENSDPFA